MRRVALLLFLCLGAMGALAAPALAAGLEPVVTGAVNNASPSLPSGSTGVGMQAGPLSRVTWRCRATTPTCRRTSTAR